MSEHLHDIDEIFKSAYQQFKDEPIADVWGKINATLDKKMLSLIKRDLSNGNGFHFSFIVACRIDPL